MLNYIWVAFFLVGFGVALFKVLCSVPSTTELAAGLLNAGSGLMEPVLHQTLVFPGPPPLLSSMLTGIFDISKTGFEIALGLTGVMALWLGIMKIGEKAGVVGLLARGVAPLFRVLFKGVPKGHPVYGSITMNLTANMLGLDNAATPMGLKAMSELQELNPGKERASDAQIMFLVLNTAGIALVPSSIMAIRQAIAVKQGLEGFNVADVFLPTLIATFVSFLSGIIIVSIAQRINLLRLPVLIFVALFAVLIGSMYYYVLRLRASGLDAEAVGLRIGAAGSGFILLLIALFIGAGIARRQKVFEDFVEGAKEGFGVAVRIIPYLIGMLVAISVLRSSGCMEYLTEGIARLAAAAGLNTEFTPVVPIMLMKPLSGSGARALMVDVLNEYGAGSFEGRLAAIVQGTTETTFYVLAVYFGAAGIKNSRNALACGLLADLIGMIAAVLLGYLFFH